MTYSVLKVAKYIITCCVRKGNPISNLKLQKILYFLWIDYFKKTQCYLFKENIFAWQFGPVVPDVYYEFCSYAGTPITRVYNIEEFASDDIDVINKIIDQYIEYSASRLVELTHKINTPWSCVYRNGLGFREIIPFSLIIDMECC